MILSSDSRVANGRSLGSNQSFALPAEMEKLVKWANLNSFFLSKIPDMAEHLYFDSVPNFFARGYSGIRPAFAGRRTGTGRFSLLIA